jgi:UDP-N-acetylmuramoyl-tripeptide--D-alanyl-D-alanine ligase
MALQTLGNMKLEGKRIAVLGDMLELGKESGNLHKQIGAMVPEMNFDMLLAVGKEAKKYVEGAKARGMKNVQYFETVPEVVTRLSEIVAEGDVLLVKGSRGMHLEQVVEALLHMVPVLKF